MAESLLGVIRDAVKTNDGIYQAAVISLNPFKIQMINDEKNKVSPIISERMRYVEWHVGDRVHVLVMKNKYFILDHV